MTQHKNIQISYDQEGRPISVILYYPSGPSELYTRTQDGIFYISKFYNYQNGGKPNPNKGLALPMKEISRDDLTRVNAPFNLVDILEAHDREEVIRLAKVEVIHAHN